MPEQARDEIAPLLFDILMHSIRRVTVAGAGVLGAQIAFQAAVHGFNLFLDVNDGALEASRRTVEALRAAYDGNGAVSPEQTAAALAQRR